MSFYLYRENKLEVLAGRFVDEVYNASPAASLIAGKHLIVVQTRGMSEYLRQYIAAECGIAANLEMPFLNSFINQICRSIYGDAFKYASMRSEQKNMRRELMKLLSDPEFVANEVPELVKYLSGSSSELKRWQLAGKTADLFDQYQLYRSKELYEHKLFSGNSFQGRLYRELFDESHPGRDWFFEKLRREGVPAGVENLPQEISIFGVGALPPVYLDILVNLSRVCRVNFFYLSPCLEYWEYQLSRREQRQQAWQITEAGNPILQALGRQGRSFFSALLANNQIAPDWEPSLREPDDDPGNTMLEVMQHDILYLFDRRPVESLTDAGLVGKVRSDLKEDRSVVVHNCHSSRRELEVLHDELLKLITVDHIEPHRIIVMAPDIAKLAPVINAVFGNGALKDVYSIADLPPRSQVMASDAFHRILSVAAGRFEYSEIMALLDLPFISEALDLPEGKLAQFGKVLYDSGVRWGFNGAMRKKFCSADFDEFSWQMAMDRILAGLVCRSSAGETSPLVGNIKAYDGIALEDMLYFARLVRLVENLAALSEKISTALSMSEWVKLFENICKDFFCDSNLQRTALMPLRSALKELDHMAQNGFLPGKYPLSAALAILDDHWELSGESGRFLRGRITFCRMVPMRSIPHDVVAILDLNEGDFPRRSTSVGFDMIEMHHQNGDRSMPSQDRYLLLEAIMSARKNLLLFYQGRSSRTNQDKPPCAPLSEIMHYLENAFGLQEYKHKLTGIDPAYFVKDAPYRSLDMENFLAAKAMQQPADTAESAEDMPEKIASPQWQKSVTIDEMITFFSNPCRWVMRNQMGVFDSDSSIENSDDEPWVLERYNNWQVDSLLVEMSLKQRSDAYTHAVRSNLLPPGSFGAQAFEERRQITDALPECWREWLQNSCRMPVIAQVELPDGISKISGMTNMSLDQNNVLVYRFSSYKARSALEALFGALTATVANQKPVGAQILSLSKGVFEHRYIEPFEVQTAQEILSDIFNKAMQQYDWPIPLFPESSVYYSDPDTAGRKFYSVIRFDEFGDALEENIRRFYAPSDWEDTRFSADFNKWAELLYSYIKTAPEGEQ